MTIFLAIVAVVIVASTGAWLYGRRWSAPQPRARITKDYGVESDSYPMWKVEIFNNASRVVPLETYWVRWSDALDFANRRVDMERKRR